MTDKNVHTHTILLLSIIFILYHFSVRVAYVLQSIPKKIDMIFVYFSCSSHSTQPNCMCVFLARLFRFGPDSVHFIAVKRERLCAMCSVGVEERRKSRKNAFDWSDRSRCGVELSMGSSITSHFHVSQFYRPSNGGPGRIAMTNNHLLLCDKTRAHNVSCQLGDAVANGSPDGILIKNTIFYSRLKHNVRSNHIIFMFQQCVLVRARTRKMCFVAGGLMGRPRTPTHEQTARCMRGVNVRYVWEWGARQRTRRNGKWHGISGHFKIGSMK